MAQLWGGRFTKETDKKVYDFNASIRFDKRLLERDCEGSVAHAAMLSRCNIITQEESTAIIDGLISIKNDVLSGNLEITDEYEDIHSFMEANLIKRIGDTGKKLHTGRSRNDQVALDMRLYTRLEVIFIDEELKKLLDVILQIMDENTDTYMP
ncbi:MAG: argininosuccinate lyase, partial [Lachnospiraceae bacterium]|nr:argininosuccinate lyase [Lachnospiraceae bacterium]